MEEIRSKRKTSAGQQGGGRTGTQRRAARSDKTQAKEAQPRKNRRRAPHAAPGPKPRRCRRHPHRARRAAAAARSCSRAWRPPGPNRAAAAKRLPSTR